MSDMLKEDNLPFLRDQRHRTRKNPCLYRPLKQFQQYVVLFCCHAEIFVGTKWFMLRL